MPSYQGFDRHCLLKLLVILYTYIFCKASRERWCVEEKTYIEKTTQNYLTANPTQDMMLSTCTTYASINIPGPKNEDRVPFVL